MTEIRNITWQELKDFCNGIDEKHLADDVAVIVGESTERVIAQLTTGNTYYHKDDNEDVWDKDEFEKLPDFIKDKMKTSKQYIKMFGESATSEEIVAGDIPF